MSEPLIPSTPEVIWLVEDDYLQTDALREHLESKFPRAARAEIVPIYSESEFLMRVQDAYVQGKQRRPRLVIADVMLPWSFPGDSVAGVTPDPEVQNKNGFRNAGVRCWRNLRKYEGNERGNALTPFVYHTVLRGEEFDLGNNEDDATGYVAKDRPMEELDATILEFTDWNAEWPASGTMWRSAEGQAR